VTPALDHFLLNASLTFAGDFLPRENMLQWGDIGGVGEEVRVTATMMKKGRVDRESGYVFIVCLRRCALLAPSLRKN
jgi:hypothetical protein